MVNKNQNVVGNPSGHPFVPNPNCEKVSAKNAMAVSFEKFSPNWIVIIPRFSGRKTMFSHDVSDGGFADIDIEKLYSAVNFRETFIGLFGNFYDKLFDLFRCFGSSTFLPFIAVIKFLSNVLSMPFQKSFGFDDLSGLFKKIFIKVFQLFSEFSKLYSFAVGQLQFLHLFFEKQYEV